MTKTRGPAISRPLFLCEKGKGIKIKTAQLTQKTHREEGGREWRWEGSPYSSRNGDLGCSTPHPKAGVAPSSPRGLCSVPPCALAVGGWMYPRLREEPCRGRDLGSDHAQGDSQRPHCPQGGAWRGRGGHRRLAWLLFQHQARDRTGEQEGARESEGSQPAAHSRSQASMRPRRPPPRSCQRLDS